MIKAFCKKTVLGSAMLGLAATAVMAQKADQAGQAGSANTNLTASTGAGWVVNCTNDGDDLNCQALMTVTSTQNNQRILRLTVTRDNKDENGAMLLQLPLGLYLLAGVELKVDEQEPVVAKIQTCNTQGCYAGQPLDDKLLQQFFKGNQLALTFQNINRRPIAVTLPLTGFTKAYKKL